MTNQEKRNLISQWAFDTRPILGRFHLWLEDVEIEWVKGENVKEFTRNISFLNGAIERLFALTGAVTALGTKIFGDFGKGKGLDKKGLNEAKKNADAISAYVMSEGLWYLSRQLPENHAIMVSLGEGLMPKAGETPEMGSNPQLGFGRVYARPEVAKLLDSMVIKLLNDNNYRWDEFYSDLKERGITIWGAAIDTLENTSRFAKGSDTGPMTILHLFDQPLQITKPYEGYVGNIFLPREVVTKGKELSVLLNFRTPRKKIVEVIEETYPGVKREKIHVWTLRGASRTYRIGDLWKEWEELGVNLIDDDWTLPTGIKAFTDSGTYAPVYSVKAWTDENGEKNVFLCDGYAASAEAVQAASLSPVLDIEGFLNIFTSSFDLPYKKEQHIMSLDINGDNFNEELATILGEVPSPEKIVELREAISEGIDAQIPVGKGSINADDFFPEKKWDVLAVSGFMCPDPYSGNDGVEKVSDGIYKVTVRLASPRGEKKIVFTLRMMETFDESRLVFSPLLNRFMAGEDHMSRPVKISDSGRIRNELQTLCSEAIEFTGEENMTLHFNMISSNVIPDNKRKMLYDILKWYVKEHPMWFSWLEIRNK
ncbi:MAG: hypothetical protein KAS21_02545 [Candidatus Aminicenantes bacterium]|nr:hypothetical protein [Candidatus Aminicenantes bacterium]